MLQIVQQAERHQTRTAIREGGSFYTYHQLLYASRQLASVLLHDEKDLKESRVAFMVHPGLAYVKTLWGIWQAGGIAVPLFLNAPSASLDYILRDTEASILVVSEQLEDSVRTICSSLNIRVVVLESLVDSMKLRLPDPEPDRAAMILYTSGTTNLPKGVVITHHNLQAQIQTLVKAWEWSEEDHTLCVLPLHHVHGIVNVVCCSLWAGACCEFIPSFSAESVFRIFRQNKVNVFMAVPTIYYKLLAFYETLPVEEQTLISGSLQQFRLMVSGSAALPVSVLEKWETISNHILLERYGMTEIGMAISNPYRGKRKPGSIGLPLPGVEVRLCGEHNVPVYHEPGEIQVRGDTVFKMYWHKEEATQQSFTADGWFKTGDIAEIDEEGYFKILGRNSVDIIKSGGYKISALEIEEFLRRYPNIKDCSVVGIPDEEWGELVVAFLVMESTVDTASLDKWLRERLSTYKIPRVYKQVDELPRNALGKVIKKELKLLF